MFGSLTALSALVFGTEFQNRTLPLLLTQPRERSKIWNDKMRALLSAAVSAILGYAMLLFFGWLIVAHFKPPVPGYETGFDSEDLLYGGLGLLVVICSGCYWTLIARSTVGGMVFSIAAPFLGASLGSLLLYVIYRSNIPDNVIPPAMTLGAIIYAAFFLWLGRRAFLGLELADSQAGDSGARFTLVAAKPSLLGFLRCQPVGPTANLFRKELRLQKPVFQIAGVFIVCWLVTWALLLLQPSRQALFEIIFNVMTSAYLPLLLVLAGCISLGEETLLGLREWHLTLPISVGRQWLIKLTVAVVTGIALGFVLPLVAALLVQPIAKVGLVSFMDNGSNNDSNILQLALFGIGVLVAGFWAATSLGNTIRAALIAVAGLPSLGACAFLGVWLALHCGGLQTDFWINIAIQSQWLPSRMWNLKPEIGSVVISTVVGLVALLQSLRQFRRAQSTTQTLWKHGALLGMLALLLGYAFEDYEVSRVGVLNWEDYLQGQLVAALRHYLAANPPVSRSDVRTITVTQLEQGGRLTEDVTKWLRNGSIRIQPWVAPGPNLGFYNQADVSLPNHLTWSIPFEASPTPRYGRP
jgi:hypothetical protein